MLLLKFPRYKLLFSSELLLLLCYCLATSGEEGRNSIMKEIGLGKELGDSPQENIVQFIGCVTTQSKKAILCPLFENCNYFSLLFVRVIVFIDKNKY